MKKRWISLALCLVLVFTLFPAMQAAAANQTPAAKDDKEMYLSKTYDPTAGTLTLEAYAKGKTTKTETLSAEPCDIVLVLDQSGSMTNKMNSGVTRLEALKTAVTSFLGIIQETGKNSPVDHRVAIVGFASAGSSWINTELLSTENVVSYGNAKAADYRNALVYANADADRLTAAVNRLDAQGYTYTEYGYQMARAIFNNSDPSYTAGGTTGTRKRVVVVFTDGNTNSTYKNVALQSMILQSEDYNASIYTVGLGDELNAENEELLTMISSYVTDNYQVNYSPVIKNGQHYYYLATGTDIGIHECSYDAKAKKWYKVGDTSHSFSSFKDNVYSTDGVYCFDIPALNDPPVNNYYKHVSEADELRDIFEEIAHSSTEGGSYVTLGADTVVRDVMSDTFCVNGTADDIQVYTVVCTGEDKFDEQAQKADGVTVTVSGQTVEVTGFDFSENWCGLDDSTPHGKKLRIVIPVKPIAGASGEVFTNDADSGIYKEDGTLVRLFPQPTIGAVVNVIDYNAKMILAEGTNTVKPYVEENGSFDTTQDHKLYYQLNTNPQANGKAVINAPYSAADVAVADSSEGWKVFTAVPASAIYFDDDLTNQTLTNGTPELDKGDDTAYVTNDTAVGAKNFVFTFTGAAIDVYCTTDTSSESVTAFLLGEDNTVIGDAVMMRNYSGATRYNTPTLHFEPGYGTYRLVVSATANANYKLDGVRVYGAVQNETLYENTTEQYAQYYRLRDQLLNDNQPFTVTEGPLDAEDISGVLFLAEQDEGVIENYDTPLEVYTALSPKSEIYLGKDQALAFTLTDAVQAALAEEDSSVHIYLGMSTPDAESESTEVRIGSGSVTVNSYVDQYYDVTELISGGTVKIENTTDVMLSLTNLKITGLAPETAGARENPFGAMTRSALRSLSAPAAVEEPAVEVPVTAPSAPTSLQSVIRQIVSNFVTSLFGSFSRLFGK